jgi:signal transduction histidine kinase
MRALRLLASVAAVGCIYAAGAVLTYHFLAIPESGASFFPPAGITLATLLLTPRRTWPLFMLAFGVAELSVDLHNHLGVFMAFGFTAANVIEPFVGATLMVVVARNTRPSPRGFFVRYLLLAVVAGPLVGGIIGGIVSSISGAEGIFPTAAEWWLGDALGVLVVATPLLAYTRRDFYRTPATKIESVLIAFVALAVTIVPAVVFHETAAYAVLPVLVLAAIRGGPVGVGISGIGVALGANWVITSGHAHNLLATRGTEGALVDTQLFIAVTVIAAFALAVEIAERTRAEARLRQTETNLVRTELIAFQAAETERRRIARETHDIVGHALNVMILSGAAARRVFDRNPTQARQLLATVEDVGREAFRDLDVALGLTDQSADFASPKGIADLQELVDRLVQAGMHVEYAVEGSPRPLPRLVDGSAYRIIQESLTNVAQHAIDSRTNVNVRYASEMLFLEISDHGSRMHATNGNGGGRGLIGMRERVAVLGGRLVAGPIGERGYSVVAELPLEAI